MVEGQAHAHTYLGFHGGRNGWGKRKEQKLKKARTLNTKTLAM